VDESSLGLKPFFMLALLSVGLIGVGVVSLLPAALSCMILDAPGSEQRLAPVALMFSILSFPIACFYAARKAITAEKRPVEGGLLLAPAADLCPVRSVAGRRDGPVLVRLV
jgi:hypothetical protein